jgi:hypothetical protein
MSNVLDDKVLAQLDVIASTLRDWRRAQFADARLINASFDVKVSEMASPPISTGFDKIVDIDMSRVFLMIATSSSSITVVPGQVPGPRHGFQVSSGNPLQLSIREAPGLVSLDWYFGTLSISVDTVYVIEILDKRRR